MNEDKEILIIMQELDFNLKYLNYEKKQNIIFL